MATQVERGRSDVYLQIGTDRVTAVVSSLGLIQILGSVNVFDTVLGLGVIRLLGEDPHRDAQVGGGVADRDAVAV